MIVFSSDYPHTEGNADPIGLYGEGLDAFDENTRQAFLGNNLAECFKRMNDPPPASILAHDDREAIRKCGRDADTVPRPWWLHKNTSRGLFDASGTRVQRFEDLD
jgi:hypothetical protein